MLVVPNSISLGVLNTLVGMGAVLAGAKMHLFKTSVTPTVNSVLADFTLADFTGYATSAAITWGTAFLDPSQIPSIAGDLKTFTAGDPLTTPNTVYGYLVTNGAGDTLLFAELFPAPVLVGHPFDAVVVVPVFQAISQQL